MGLGIRDVLNKEDYDLSVKKRMEIIAGMELRLTNRLSVTAETRVAPLSVAVTLGKLVHESAMSLPLFPEDRRRQQLGCLMDQINTKFGPQSIYMATMKDAVDTAPMRISFTKIPDIEVEADGG